MSIRRVAAFVVVPVLAVAGLAACGSDDDGGSATTTAAGATTTAAAGATTTAGGATTSAAAGGGSTITVADFAYSPKELTVKVGTVVDVKNTQGVDHTITADDGSFDEDLAADGSAKLTLDAAGSFPYHCEIHSSMTGTITVEA